MLLPVTVLDLRGSGTPTKCVVAYPTTLSPFPPGFLYDRKKLSQLCQDGTCSCLQGVVCAHLKGSYVFNKVMLCVLSLKCL